MKRETYMKQIALIKFDDSDKPWMIYKDVGMFLYELAKNYNWEGKYLYFNTTYFTKIGMRNSLSMLSQSVLRRLLMVRIRKD